VKVFDGTKWMLRRPATHDAAPEKGALVFACPRDNGANALRLRFREGTSSEASEAPITHSRNTALYRASAAERKAYRMANQGNRVKEVRDKRRKC
jgi:hypothetical protein